MQNPPDNGSQQPATRSKQVAAKQDKRRLKLEAALRANLQRRKRATSLRSGD